MNTVLIAILVVGSIGLIVGVFLSLASEKFHVQVNENVEKIRAVLPGNNCGACGYPGCSGFAEGILTGDVKTLKQCKPMKPEIRIEIKEYLENSPSPQGTIIKVEV